ncbi:preprotein translocase subunit SecG [Candidatus Desantisbacteria bacterium]|nr:preprotein translocase subunit SecG [Candidatus Desantisbacteria bacterium]
MVTFITVIHVIVAICLVLLILIQTTKSDATAFLGGGSSSDIFGGKGPLSFITKTTAVLAIVFFLTSTYLAIAQDHKKRSIIQNVQFPERPVAASKSVPASKPFIPDNKINATETQPTTPVQAPVKATVDNNATGNTGKK